MRRWISDKCARGDLNSSKPRDIGIHLGALEAQMSGDFTRADHHRSIQIHRDAQAQVSRALLTAARSPPANPMH